MPRRSSHPFDALADRFAQIFTERVSAALPKTGRNGVARKAGSLKRDMSCRYPGCKNRSKGPRFRFLCEEHLKLPKKKQDEVLLRSEEHTSELQSRGHLVCRLLLEKKKRTARPNGSRSRRSPPRSPTSSTAHS